MRLALQLTIRFAAAVIRGALEKRWTTSESGGQYSAVGEVRHLARDLSELNDLSSGLTMEEALQARELLDALLEAQRLDPLNRIETGLRLARTERDIFRLLLAWAVEPRIATLMGHLNDSLSNCTMTHGALAQLLNTPEEVALALCPGSPLRIQHAVESTGFGPDAIARPDPRLVAFAIEGKPVPLRTDQGRLGLVCSAPSGALQEFLESAVAADIVVLRGPEGSGRRTAAQAIAAREGRPLLAIELQGEPRADSLRRDLLIAARRDARILGARLLVCGPFTEAEAEQLAESKDIPLALILEEGVSIPRPLLSREVALVPLPTPTADRRREIWVQQANGRLSPEKLDLAAEHYPLTPGQIRRAAVQLGRMSLDEACRMQLDHDLDRFASATRLPADWERLVLPEASMAALKSLCAQVKHHHTVDDLWGFGAQHGSGRGVKALFHGPPGTGKTFAAKIVACDLNLPLYRVDVARILSRWVGESEQHLARLFDEARRAQAVLFFDEADSFFGERTSIGNSTDRYANIQVNYLLQRVEEHDGAIILATNMKSNIDVAFMRRLHYVVEFPEPDVQARKRIWRVCIPTAAPLGKDVDLDALAQSLEIAGGAIKNAITSAAYLAAEDRSAITLRHISVAVRREYAKLDRLPPEFATVN